VEAELIPGRYSGVYDVVVDGQLLYSKKKTGRFPEKGEVVGLIDKARAGT
jgi:selT/selW/selH-like putative selenoprotein